MKKNENQNVWQYSHVLAGKWILDEEPIEAMIIVVLKGSMILSMGKSQLVVGAGEMFLKPPGLSCEGEILEKVKLISCRFAPLRLFSTYIVRDLFICSRETQAGKLTILKTHGAFARYLDLLEYYLATDIAVSEIWNIKRKEFFCLLLRTYNRELLMDFLCPIMDEQAEFHHFVAFHWKKARNVEELASMAHLSTSGFMKKFRKYYCESPYHWMIRQKTECILEDLNNGQIPLKELADKYHFASYTHFGQFCKAHYGMSPKELLLINKGIGRKVEIVEMDSDMSKPA